ncbi:hypothetical protein DWB68_06280 [Galactobacter valiniphilus]|uniref:Tyr recombinase domain-containing protein n=1 Tax=Galactobacter valiniphilus TaxID=2676122 RepID=A0A399JBG0_9MICC|nr:hypothetical protein [Galactobacter valiniphilus]RII42554.1 hypothetical protein DWB68_06280 [Galactobacter valiniphilus]
MSTPDPRARVHRADRIRPGGVGEPKIIKKAERTTPSGRTALRFTASCSYRALSDGAESTRPRVVTRSADTERAALRAAEDAAREAAGLRRTVVGTWESGQAATVADVWTAYLERRGQLLGQGTRDHYTRAWKNWLSPFIGHVPVGDLRQKDLRDVLDRILQGVPAPGSPIKVRARHKVGGAGAADTARAVLLALERQARDTGVRLSGEWGVPPTDAGAVLGKGATRKRAPVALDSLQLAALTAKTDAWAERESKMAPAKYRWLWPALIRVAALTGARPGEILGMQRADIRVASQEPLRLIVVSAGRVAVEGEPAIPTYSPFNKTHSSGQPYVLTVEASEVLARYLDESKHSRSNFLFHPFNRRRHDFLDPRNLAAPLQGRYVRGSAYNTRSSGILGMELPSDDPLSQVQLPAKLSLKMLRKTAATAAYAAGGVEAARAQLRHGAGTGTAQRHYIDPSLDALAPIIDTQVVAEWQAQRLEAMYERYEPEA